MARILHIAAIVSIILAIPLNVVEAVDPACPQPGQAALDLSLDGVTIEGCLPFAPAGSWQRPDPAQAVQIAYTAGTGASYTFTAIPFGAHNPLEIFPIVNETSSIANLRDLLRQYRLGQGAQVENGPTAEIFGMTVESLVSTLAMPGKSVEPEVTRLTEWLTVAGGRLWILRAAQPAPYFAQGTTSTAGLSLTSTTLDAPSTSAATLHNRLSATATPSPASPASAESDPFYLASPSWWTATCDNKHYLGSYALGSSFRNVITCGPQAQYGYPDVLVYFYGTAFPAYEWECVELALRFMYLAYGVPPYAANGGYIVYNYSGSKLKRINNNTGAAPVPGDVLSYCSYCTYGHTSVVTKTDIDGSGNGTVTVMEQNWTVKGVTVLNVSKYMVIGDAGWVYGWLHYDKSPVPSPTPSPTMTPTCTPIPTATLAPTLDPSATPYPGGFKWYLSMVHTAKC
jgi:hypothetical protein